MQPRSSSGPVGVAVGLVRDPITAGTAGAMLLPPRDLGSAGWGPATTTIPATTTVTIIPAMAIAAPPGTVACGSASGLSAAGGNPRLGGQPGSAGWPARHH